MFYEKLKELSAAKGVSITQMAKDLGISTGLQTGWKNGATPRQSTVKKIADYFGVAVDYFASEDSAQNKEMPQPESQVEAQFAEMFSKLSDANKLEVISRMIAMQAEAGKDR